MPKKTDQDIERRVANVIDAPPGVILTMPLRDARAMRDSLRNTLCFLRGMRAGAGPDAEDGPESGMLVDLRALAARLDEVVEPALVGFEGPHEMLF